MATISRRIDYITFLYLALPILIFLLGWLNIYYGIFFSTCLILSVYLYLNNKDNSFELPADSVFNKWTLFVAVVAFLWVYFSGVGGFANQDWDHHFRNALFRDLIQQDWPVYYTFPANYKIPELAGKDSALNYYLTYWLPAAVIGKLSIKSIADTTLFVWSYLGVLLVLYYLNKLFSFKHVLITSVLFMLWSGTDILGKVILEKHALYPEEAVDVYYHYFYTSFTTDLFNVYNQVIPTWLITLWVLNNRKEINIVPITLLLAYAPFPFIGLVAFHGLVYTFEYFLIDKGQVKAFIDKVLREFLQVKTIAVIIGVLVPYGLFYGAHTSDVPTTLFWNRFPEETVIKSIKSGITYLITYSFEVGVYLAIIFIFSRTVYRENKVTFWVCCFVLLIMPILVIGQFGDFASRGSIPLLTAVCVLTLKTVIGYFEQKKFAYVGMLMIPVFLLSWMTPTIAFLRSVPTTGSPKLREAIITYSDPAVTKQNDKQMVYSSLMNFYSYNPKRYAFYKYVAKH